MSLTAPSQTAAVRAIVVFDGGYGAIRYSLRIPDLFAAANCAESRGIYAAATERFERAGFRRVR